MPSNAQDHPHMRSLEKSLIQKLLRLFPVTYIGPTTCTCRFKKCIIHHLFRFLGMTVLSIVIGDHHYDWLIESHKRLFYFLQRLADELGISFIESSAKNCSSVDDIFRLLVEQILIIHHDASSSTQSSHTRGMLRASGSSRQKPPRGKGCCS